MREQRTTARREAREAVIVFAVNGCRFAIAAAAVGEIRGTEGLRAFDLETRALRVTRPDFMLERGGRSYFVIDAGRFFHLAPAVPGRVLILRPGSAALLVESTDRMMEISVLHALPRAFCREERTWYRGLAVLDGEVLPVVNPAAFLSRAEQAVLKTQLERAAGAAV